MQNPLHRGFYCLKYTIIYGILKKSGGDSVADEKEILKKRFRELYNRSQNRGIYVYSDFLNAYEQALLEEEIRYGYTLWGGYPDAERKIACFGNENDFGYSPCPPVEIVCISPLSEKFADDLNHRDFLGSLMGLGIKRETLGDIVINKNKGYLICLDTMAKYIIDNLTKVRHTSVTCERCNEIPIEYLPQPKEKMVIVSSLRLDVLISGVYDISRSKSSALIDGEKVFINGKLTKSNSVNIENGSMISVRGYGRFRYTEVLGTTRKDRIRILCEIY